MTIKLKELSDLLHVLVQTGQGDSVVEIKGSDGPLRVIDWSTKEGSIILTS